MVEPHQKQSEKRACSRRRCMRCEGCCTAIVAPRSTSATGSHPDQLTASAPMLDGYCFTLNFGHATGASLHSHNVPLNETDHAVACGNNPSASSVETCESQG